MHLDSNNTADLEAYLKAQNWLTADETLRSATKPGEGNMNYALRVQTSSGRSFIVKQARAYVEKYPSIAAPTERAVIEGHFYRKIQHHDQLRAFMPQLVGTDSQNSVLAVEDLGQANDYTYLYQPNQRIDDSDLVGLARFASQLHLTFAGNPDAIFANRAMRALNHEHIFNYPFRNDSGFDLDTVQAGLQSVALPYQRDAVLGKAAHALGQVYLQDGRHLLHGDFYFGSFLKTAAGIKIIDPEFCFYGPAEFDLGVLIAHLKMARQSDKSIQVLKTNYESPDGFDEKLLDQFAGVEIMRRLIGLAQLPLSLSLTEKQQLLVHARELVVG